MNRPSSFVIPTASALSVLTTAAGCADPAVGTWDLAKIDYSGYVYDFPDVEVYEYNGSTYTYTNGGSMVFEKDGTGTFTQFYTYEVDGVLVEELSTSDDYAVTGTRTGKGVWDVSIAFDEALAMTCTAEKDAMSCVSTDVTVDFTRAE